MAAAIVGGRLEHFPRDRLISTPRHRSATNSKGRNPMNCLVCGNQMRLTMVEPHDEASMRGFEYRTFQCEHCGDRERQFVFDRRAPVDPASIAPANRA
jgi:hypothetical protein